MVPDLTYIGYPFLACVLLVAIHVYLGLHVLRRGVIFVDIAIAQIAALGWTFGFYMGFHPEGTISYVYALAFALGAAFLFAFARPDEDVVPQEAIIGICYVVAAGLAILLVDMAADPHGAEKIRYLMVGNLVWVTVEDLLKMSAIYLPLGAFHAFFYRRFYLVSFDEKKAREENIRVKLWDFLFYFTFGIAVTSSVKVCGVLLVFSFLIIPATCVSLFVNRMIPRLLWAWLLGLAVSFAGLLFSWDRPSGPTIISFFAAALILAAIIKYFMESEKKFIAGGKLAIALGAFVLSLWLIGYVGKRGEKVLHQEEGKKGHLHRHGERKGKEVDSSDEIRSLREALIKELHGLDPLERDRDLKEICQECRKLGKKKLDQLAAQLIEKAREHKASEFKLNAARLLLLLGKKEALPLAFDVMESAPGALVRDNAATLVRGETGKNFGYDPFAGEKERKKAVQKWRQWWEKQEK